MNLRNVWIGKLSGYSASHTNELIYKELKKYFKNSITDKDFNYIKGYIVEDIRTEKNVTEHLRSEK